jgi:hypothetical protein
MVQESSVMTAEALKNDKNPEKLKNHHNTP